MLNFLSLRGTIFEKYLCIILNESRFLARKTKVEGQV